MKRLKHRSPIRVSEDSVSHIAHRDFDLSRAEPTEQKWSYRRTIMFVTACGSIFWAAIIIVCVVHF